MRRGQRTSFIGYILGLMTVCLPVFISNSRYIFHQFHGVIRVLIEYIRVNGAVTELCLDIRKICGQCIFVCFDL